MILLALLLQTAAQPPVDGEVVVIARQMRMIRVDMKAPTSHGLVTLKTCRITRSSGVAALDAIPCAVAQECVASGMPSRKALERCVELGSVQRVNTVAAKRRAAR